MSRAESIEPLDPREGGSDPPPSSKPDWLVGSDDVTRDPGGARRQAPPPPPDRKPRLELVREEDSPPAPEDSDDDSAEADAPPPAGATGKGAWKAAASSVPRLRQQPAAARQPDEQESFAGFAQDAMMASTPAIGSSGSTEMAGADGGEAAMPLAQAPPFWIDWLERLGSVPRPVMIGAGVVLVLGLMVYLLYPRGTPGVSLAQIQQHPEAYTGRSVLVKGKAGESFSVGGSYVYNLYQGRDSIVVYSRTTPPRLRERVKVEGTVSIGYLDGVPRVALLESQSTP